MKPVTRTALAIVALLGITRSVLADPAPAELCKETTDKGLAYLHGKQNVDGTWGDAKSQPGIAALILRAMVQDKDNGYTNDFVVKGYDALLKNQKDDGGIYVDMLANYNTAIAVSALGPVKDEKAIAPHLQKAVAFLKGEQWGPTVKPPDGVKLTKEEYATWEGGFGYNRHSRPDLSNAHFTIQALHDAGISPDDPAFQEAIKFVTRCQNRSESNDQKFAGNDGGFIYSPANGGDSEAEDYVTPDGQKRWRSYGTMTYAGIKSMLYAGVKKDDPRVKAGVDWVRANWTLDENPGLSANKPEQAKNGIYYMFHVMAKALHAYGDPVITDTSGKTHDWRVELIEKVASLQNADGSWIGDKRWMEDNPLIVTGYCTLALEEAQMDLAEHPAK